MNQKYKGTKSQERQYFEKYGDLINEKQRIFDIAYENSKVLAYKTMFGEYMSRDAAARAKLDLMDRLKTMPFSSEPGMTPEKMIYRYK